MAKLGLLAVLSLGLLGCASQETKLDTMVFSMGPVPFHVLQGENVQSYLGDAAITKLNDLEKGEVFVNFDIIPVCVAASRATTF